MMLVFGILSFKPVFSLSSFTFIKSLLIKVKEEGEIFDLKVNNQKTNIMASSPITSWKINGEAVETVAGFILGGSKLLQMVIAAMK